MTDDTISNVEALLQRYIHEERLDVALDIAKALGKDALVEQLAAEIIDSQGEVVLEEHQRVEPTSETYLPDLEEGKNYTTTDYFESGERARKAKDYHNASILYENACDFFAAAGAAEKSDEKKRAAELYFKSASMNTNNSLKQAVESYRKAAVLYGKLGHTKHMRIAAQKTNACNHIISLDSLFEEGCPRGENAQKAFTAIDGLIQLSERDLLFKFVKELHYNKRYELVEFCLAKLMWDGHTDIHNPLSSVIIKDKIRLTKERENYADWLVSTYK